MKKSAQEIWETYVSSWQAKTEAERKRLYEQALRPDCTYSDPLTVAHGWQQLTDYMAQFHEQIPGGHFVTREFIAHHDCSIARWDMMNGKGEKISDGMSYGKYDDEGRLHKMTGFFEVPAP